MPILLVVSDFNKLITDELHSGAVKTLQEQGLTTSDYKTVYVPGAFELPLVCAKAARSQAWSAIIAIGCVIRGETDHYDYVCAGVQQGLMQITLETQVPVIFCVLTTNTEDQAKERCGLLAQKTVFGLKPTMSNKGVYAALAALQMIEVLDSI